MRVGAAGILVLMTVACGGTNDAADSTAAAADSMPAAPAVDTMTTAQAAMRDSSGLDIGTLTISESGGALAVSGTLRSSTGHARYSLPHGWSV